MGEITRQPARAIQNALIDSVLAGLCALIVFGPIVGVVLKGYGFTLAPARVAILVAVVMAGRLALSLLLQSHRGKAFIARFEGADDGVYVRPPGYRSRLRWIIPLLVGLAIVFPFLATKYLLTVAILGLIYVLLGLGLNIVVGLAGLLDLGYVAFYAIGAYGLALGYQYLGLGFWAMLPLGAVMAALAGALLGFPVLRMHGDYLAIVTLGFGEIIRLVLNNWVSFTGGPNGVPVPSPTLFGLEFTRRAKDGGIPIHEFFHVSYNPNLKFIFLYAVLCLVVMLVLLVKHRLTRMPIGRAWEALREDEIACRAMGLNHVLVKLSAFMLGASTAGIAGVFFASYQGFVNPTSFTFFESALILAIVVLGGMGSTLGVVLAAFVLTVTPELLRGFDEYRVLLFGVLMVMMMIWRPRGLARTFQNIRLFREMSVIENLLVAQHTQVNRHLLAGILNTRGYRQAESQALDRAFYWLEVVEMVDCANRLAGTLSYGQQRRLEIARAMCTRPEMICLDEPAAGLNPVETQALSRIIRFLRQQHGITVLLIEHDMGMVMEISDHIIVLDHGDVIARGAPQAIQANASVIAAYLGAEEEETRR